MDIKTVTVVPADRFVAVNGEGYNFDFTVVDPMPGVPAAIVHAIQWFGDHGQVEVSRGPGRGFTDGSIIAPYVSRWLFARAAQLTAAAIQAAKQVEAHEQFVAKLTTDLASLDKDISAAEAEAGSGGKTNAVAAMRVHHDTTKASLDAHMAALEVQREASIALAARGEAAAADAGAA